jgi:hypothetical protein
MFTQPRAEGLGSLQPVPSPISSCPSSLRVLSVATFPHPALFFFGCKLSGLLLRVVYPGCSCKTSKPPNNTPNSPIPFRIISFAHPPPPNSHRITSLPKSWGVGASGGAPPFPDSAISHTRKSSQLLSFHAFTSRFPVYAWLWGTPRCGVSGFLLFLKHSIFKPAKVSSQGAYGTKAPPARHHQYRALRCQNAVHTASKLPCGGNFHEVMT